MNDNERGLYSKYQVLKDGKPLDGDCFILRPDRDPAAVAALRAYAGETKNDVLARDIISWIGAPEPITLEQLRQMDGEPVYVLRLDNPDMSKWMLAGRTKLESIYDFVELNKLDDKEWFAYANAPRTEM